MRRNAHLKSREDIRPALKISSQQDYHCADNSLTLRKYFSYLLLT